MPAVLDRYITPHKLQTCLKIPDSVDDALLIFQSARLFFMRGRCKRKNPIKIQPLFLHRPPFSFLLNHPLFPIFQIQTHKPLEGKLV